MTVQWWCRRPGLELSRQCQCGEGVGGVCGGAGFAAREFATTFLRTDRHQKRRAFRCFTSRHKPSRLHKNRETRASRQSLKRSIYRKSASLSQDTGNMEQQKQLQSLTNEYQSLQNGMSVILTLVECLSFTKMLIPLQT